ncbi:MAG: FtsW/RodA/SpoVE family cell cycle protein [Oscillospiraceae bacterium]|nr:FtsW/RodA/SpoVE family cell cycle protein [Oscillospiraceae bacterium]
MKFFEAIGSALANHETVSTAFLTAMRFVFPVLIFLVLYRCARSLLTFRKQPEIWAWLNIGGETNLPVTHWENMIGRGKGCDIVVDLQTISRSHAVLTRYDDGSWSISDVASRGGVQVDGQTVGIKAIGFGEPFQLGGVDFWLEPVTREEREEQAIYRTKPGRKIKPETTLFFLTVFQILAMLQLILNVGEADVANVAIGFGALIVLEWLIFLVFRLMRRTGYEVETIAFFLCTMGVAVMATAAPGDIKKEIIAMVMGIVLFFIVGWSLRSLERAKKVRYLAAALGLALLLFNLVFGKEVYGAKNWIILGPFSFQPSELVKVCFVFVGASTMDRIVSKRNLILFIAYSAAICGCLALMRDFGAALIFFAAFLVIAFLRSGDFAALALICAGTGFGGVLAARFLPYIQKRFAAWGHVWELATDAGYQQTRAMMCIASGGLFGLGAGLGWLKYVAASDTDLVFALVSEEWGLLVGLMMILAVVMLAAFVVRSVAVARSSFYTIGACAAACILMMQVILNVFGTVDFLPLTGVTFPFVSNGGSSMMAAWGLLGFIKAADTRQNASFAIKLPSRKEDPDE